MSLPTLVSYQPWNQEFDVVIIFLIYLKINTLIKGKTASNKLSHTFTSLLSISVGDSVMDADGDLDIFGHTSSLSGETI